MQESRPSRTALRVALRRAAHQRYDGRPLVLDDPIAIPILGPYAEELARTLGLNPALKARPFSLGLRAFLVARSRYAEDLLGQAVAGGVSQYVLLGAGLDTFAYRNPHPNLRVVEVDHPATQQWKHELLATTGLPAPANLVYAPVDFEGDAAAGIAQTLDTQLAAAGVDSARPTFFAWLGVVPYLTREAFRGTVEFVAAQPPGSGLVFDYAQPRHVLPPREQLAHDSLAARVALAGEPFQLFFTPAEAAAELAGFHDLEDLGAAELNARYFDPRAGTAQDNLRLHGTTAHLLSAWVG